METVNGSRNPFAVREALDKRSASVFPALIREVFPLPQPENQQQLSVAPLRYVADAPPITGA